MSTNLFLERNIKTGNTEEGFPLLLILFSNMLQIKFRHISSGHTLHDNYIFPGNIARIYPKIITTICPRNIIVLIIVRNFHAIILRYFEVYDHCSGYILME